MYHVQSHVYLYIDTHAHVHVCLCVCIFKQPELLLNVKTQTFLNEFYSLDAWLL